MTFSDFYAVVSKSKVPTIDLVEYYFSFQSYCERRGSVWILSWLKNSGLWSLMDDHCKIEVSRNCVNYLWKMSEANILTNNGEIKPPLAISSQKVHENP